MARVNVNDYDVRDTFAGRVQTVKAGRKLRYVNAWCALDTETYADADAGWIVFWSICMEYRGQSVTVWGRTPEELCGQLSRLCSALDLSENRRMVFYVHNYSYDYVFLRNFLNQAFGEPVKSLAVKPHRYINMIWSNGIEIKDSYILAQSSLEKWGKDLGAGRKSVGQWDYNKRRTPETPLTDDELNYGCTDVELLAECVRLKALQGGYGVGSIPLTATGYARDAARAAAFATDWRDKVNRMDMDLDIYLRCSATFQGGMTHGSRWHVGSVLRDLSSYDFASSYPYVMCVEKFPASKWVRARYSMRQILADAENYGFLFDLVILDAEIKPGHPMPPISQSKCTYVDNLSEWDNGKLLKAQIVVIPSTEIDLQIYLDHYTGTFQVGLMRDRFQLGEVYTCRKDYLPRWFTDTIQSYFHDKTMLKGSDPQQYQYAKGLLNSQYGMCAQYIIRPDIIENEDGTWTTRQQAEPDKILAEHYGKRNYFLPYQWAPYVTAYARRNLYQLGSCCRQWIYCDTDSVKGSGWDLDALAEYNAGVDRKLATRGILPVEFNGKIYRMGIAEHDADYSEFITLGAKRYAYREKQTGKLGITVAGVPKRGVQALNNDIYNFSRGLVFHDTGKLVPEYHMHQGITETEADGCRIQIGSWINLVPADYLLDMTDRYDDLLDIPMYMDKL